MARYEVETSTGSIYYIDQGNKKWAKNSVSFQHLHFLGEGEWDGDHFNIPDVFSWPEVDAPAVGKNMYIHGRGMHDWWLSTPIVKVTEVEKWSWE